MEKVICDICGTSYPANADQCPICGCEKSAEPIMDEEMSAMAGFTTAYKPVKGGRFSNSNVKKRGPATDLDPVDDDYDLDDEDAYDQEEDEEEVEEEETTGGSNKGLVAILVILIVAILGLIFYLYFNFFAPVKIGDKETEAVSTTTVATESQETEEPTVPCAGLEVSDTNIVLDAIGNAWLLNVVASPADTTDEVTYVSSDESVVQVSSEGCITAVGPGEAVVTVRCGNVVVECKVSCIIETEPETEPTAVETEPATTQKWGLNREEFMLYIGEQWQVYQGEVDATKITFKSKDTSVVTISKNGTVTGVGAGSTVITAEYNGVIYECKVYCRAPKTETAPTEGTTGSDDSGASSDNNAGDSNNSSDSNSGGSNDGGASGDVG